MYNPASFVEARLEVLAVAIERHPLAALVTLGPAARISASHLPLLFYPAEGPMGTLRGHMARANPQWIDHVPGSEALAIFAGPQHYISPNWYPSKKEHGKVVPTWNYVVVHARGQVTFPQDPQWLLANVTALTDAQEKHSEDAWKVSDAPADFIGGLLRAIVGIELRITSLEGKWKASQNRPEEDRRGVMAALVGGTLAK
ncbi:MAG: FMN-binding negative transcriptional regulator [Acidobacteriia bacterium]|nr:FMN-binding negative transcriptional regulator [Terriglobia bacterium]